MIGKFFTAISNWFDKIIDAMPEPQSNPNQIVRIDYLTGTDPTNPFVVVQLTNLSHGGQK
jgi:hypothetical protein